MKEQLVSQKYRSFKLKDNFVRGKKGEKEGDVVEKGGFIVEVTEQMP